MNEGRLEKLGRNALELAGDEANSAMALIIDIFARPFFELCKERYRKRGIRCD